MHSNEECLICKAKLEYLESDIDMECEICHKTEKSKCRCVNGHYVCNNCHKKGLDSIITVCKTKTSKNPFDIIEEMMNMDFCHMHGPEHHVMVGAALLVAYKNAGGDVDLDNALYEMFSRGNQVPGGSCGFWGACGAAISCGIFVSIITKSNPLSEKSWGLCNEMTSKALSAIANVGGPRCCKRNSYIAIKQSIEFVKEKFGIELEDKDVKCKFIANNNQCIGKKCPFCKK